MSQRPISQKRRVFKLTFFAGSLLFLVVSATLLWLCYQQAQNLAYPISLVAQYTPTNFGITGWREVSFQTEDDIQLNGWFIPPTETDGATVLFVHGIGGNREQLWGQAQVFLQNGYGALLFDLRNCGTSGGTVSSMGYWETLDLQAAYGFLAAQPEVNPQRIVVYGASMGGAVAIRGMTQLPEVRALIVEASYTSVVDVVGDGVRARTRLSAFPFAQIIVWLTGRESNADVFAVNSEADIARIHVPVLIIHGTVDGTIPVAHGERLYAAANEPKELWLVEGVGHGGFVNAYPQEYASRVLSFLERVFS